MGFGMNQLMDTFVPSFKNVNSRNMKFNKIPLIVLLSIVAASCNSAQKEPTPQDEKTSFTVNDSSMHTADKANYKNIVFASTSDLVCGMPVSAGVSDTAVYQNKVYGFCASECKAEFLKDPASYIAKK